METLEEHIRHMVMQFDLVKLFGTLFNECFPSGDSMVLAYQAEPRETSTAPESDSNEVVEVGMLEKEKEKLMLIIFDVEGDGC